MLHHFHVDGDQPGGQSSLTADQFSSMLDHLSRQHRLLDAHEFLAGVATSSLDTCDMCITFDDALRCQYDVAAPVLRERGLTAFFFVYSSVFCGEPDPLEIFRLFRTSAFDGSEAFYREFFALAEDRYGPDVDAARSSFNDNAYLKQFSFYTDDDRLFRHFRDHHVSKEAYHDLMFALMGLRGFDADAVGEALWMTDDHLRDLAQVGHVVGLHSYSHPTAIDQLDDMEQEREYRRNNAHLTAILGASPRVMSHPNGRYNEFTLNLMQTMGVKTGFRSNMTAGTAVPALEIPRQDHAIVLREMSS